MTSVMAAGLVIVFSFLAVLHFYWAIGGKWALKDTLPTKVNGDKVLDPGFIECVIVGIALALFAFFYFIRIGWVTVVFPSWVLIYGGWIIPSLFLLRAIGDFKYIGFFKSVKQTNFGSLDTKIYSPISLAIGIMGMWIQYYEG